MAGQYCLSACRTVSFIARTALVSNRLLLLVENQGHSWNIRTSSNPVVAGICCADWAELIP